MSDFQVFTDVEDVLYDSIEQQYDQVFVVGIRNDDVLVQTSSGSQLRMIGAVEHAKTFLMLTDVDDDV